MHWSSLPQSPPSPAIILAQFHSNARSLTASHVRFSLLLNEIHSHMSLETYSSDDKCIAKISKICIATHWINSVAIVWWLKISKSLKIHIVRQISNWKLLIIHHVIVIHAPCATSFRQTVRPEFMKKQGDAERIRRKFIIGECFSDSKYKSKTNLIPLFLTYPFPKPMWWLYSSCQKFVSL